MSSTQEQPIAFTQPRAKEIMTDAERMAIEDATGRRLPKDSPRLVRAQPSADAQFIAGKIVKHLWIIFVLLPVVLTVLWSLLK